MFEAKLNCEKCLHEATFRVNTVSISETQAETNIVNEFRIGTCLTSRQYSSVDFIILLAFKLSEPLLSLFRWTEIPVEL